MTPTWSGSLFAAATAVGLVAGDDFDGQQGVLDGGFTDQALFSLRPGSPSLGETPNGAHIFRTAFDGTFQFWDVGPIDLEVLPTGVPDADAIDTAFLFPPPFANAGADFEPSARC